ncbi:MAG: hypothetical protein ACLFQT_03775 [Thiohalophilus sp.]
MVALSSVSRTMYSLQATISFQSMVKPTEPKDPDSLVQPKRRGIHIRLVITRAEGADVVIFGIETRGVVHQSEITGDRVAAIGVFAIATGAREKSALL